MYSQPTTRVLSIDVYGFFCQGSDGFDQPTIYGPDFSPASPNRTSQPLF